MLYPSRENYVLLFNTGHAVLREKQEPSLLNPLSAKIHLQPHFYSDGRKTVDKGRMSHWPAESCCCRAATLAKFIATGLFNSQLIRREETHTVTFQDIKAATLKNPHPHWEREQAPWSVTALPATGFQASNSWMEISHASSEGHFLFNCDPLRMLLPSTFCSFFPPKCSPCPPPLPLWGLSTNRWLACSFCCQLVGQLKKPFFSALSLTITVGPLPVYLL